jgi:hypothetical protein
LILISLYLYVNKPNKLNYEYFKETDGKIGKIGKINNNKNKQKDEEEEEEEMYPYNTNDIPNIKIKTTIDKDYERIKTIFDMVIDKNIKQPNIDDLTTSSYTEDEIRELGNSVAKKINSLSDNMRENAKIFYVTYRNVKKQSSGDTDIYDIDMNMFYGIPVYFGIQIKMKILNNNNKNKNENGNFNNLYIIFAKLNTPPKYNGPIGFYGSVKDYYYILNDLHLMAPYSTSGIGYIFTKQDINKFIEERTKNKTKDEYMCFNSTNIQAQSKDECVRSGGTWDKPVEDQTKCPFYLKNINYPNQYGGVNWGGRCNLPANMQLIGYRYYEDTSSYDPLCYNCRIGLDGKVGSIGFCCKEQRNKSLYPNLKSPDYMFLGDEPDRRRYKEFLAKKGLHWNRYPK